MSAIGKFIPKSGAECRIDADNVRSIALFEKLGFKAHAGRYQRTHPFV
ncbi:hypothetical protein ACEUBQ_18705 [Aeromonas veronii]